MKNMWPIKLSLFINYFLFAILLNSVGTVIFQVQNSYGVTESTASILEAYKDLSIAITSFLIASLVFRFGYKRAMLTALAGIAAVCLLVTQLPFFWASKLLFAAVGVSFALVKISAFACISMVTKGRQQHASFMSFLEAVFMVGVLAGYFMFSFFVDDNEPGSLVWLEVYYVLAAMAGFAFVLLLLTPFEEAATATTANTTLVGEFTDMIRLCAKPLVFIFVISAFLYVLIEQSIMSWLPSFNSSVLNLSASLSIQMASILAGATAIGRLAAGLALRKVDWFKLLCGCLFMAAVLVLITMPLAQGRGEGEISQWANAPMAAFLFPLIGMCLAPIYPAINSMILSSLPSRQHGSMAGLIVVFSALGGTTGSIITGNLFEALGGQVAFYFSLIPMLLVLICLYLFKREIEKSNISVSSTP